TVETSSRGVADGEPTESALPVGKGAEVEVTAVGEKPVVLDRSASQLVLPGGTTVALEGGDQARLQQPSAASRAAVVAPADALVTQPLAGGADGKGGG